MPVKITVTSSPKNRISINNQQKKTVRTASVGTNINSIRLDDLLDVDASDPDNNETLVYDSTLQRYVVKSLSVIDGGSY